MFQTKRFGLVASKQEYLMLCHAERTLKHKKKPTGQRLPAFKERTRKELERECKANERRLPRVNETNRRRIN